MGYAVTAITFDPDSVELIGPADKIATINHIVPNYPPNQQITSKQSIVLSLPSFDFPLLVVEEEVQMSITVDQYSEINLRVRIQNLNAEENKVVRFFPNTAVLRFSAPLSELKAITAENFILGVTLPKGEEEKKKLPVRLERAPEGLRNIRWEPKEVDYLIRQ